MNEMSLKSEKYKCINPKMIQVRLINMNFVCMPLRVGFNFVLVKFWNGEGNSKAKKKT